MISSQYLDWFSTFLDNSKKFACKVITLSLLHLVMLDGRFGTLFFISNTESKIVEIQYL